MITTIKTNHELRPVNIEYDQAFKILSMESGINLVSFTKKEIIELRNFINQLEL